MDINKTPFDFNKYLQGINPSEMPPERIDEALEDFFNELSPFLQTVQFAYAVDLVRQRIAYKYNFCEYLNYEPVQVNMGLLNDIIHPDEHKKLNILYRRMNEFAKQYPIEPIKFGLVLGHQLRKADGTYIKVLRYFHPFLLDEHHKLLVYYCLCVDVSNHYFNNGITLDIILPQDAPFTRATALNYFNMIMTDQVIQFTKRQLQVIKVWSETDSPKVAAERLSMQVRTLETHLKNMRKKIGARRTLDVVVYAKDHGLI
ncbi:MAG: response regulator transcription factor [Saprospiraceae bacterium]